MPILQGGGPGFHPTPNHVIRKWTVNATLAMGHQAYPLPLRHTAKIFQHFHMTAVHQIRAVHYCYFDWGRRQ